MKALEEMDAALAAVPNLDGSQLYTAEHRLARDMAVAALMSAVGNGTAKVRAEHAKLDEDLVRALAKVRALLHERDKAVDRAQQVEATLRFWASTREYVPALGLVCDGDGCPSAIGVVGVKMLATDAMTDPCVSIAVAAGWGVVEEFGTSVEDRTVKHYCPNCQRARKKNER